MRYKVLLVLFLVFLPITAHGQWKQVLNTGGISNRVLSVCFPNQSKTIGFTGTELGDIFKTTDGGHTWRKVSVFTNLIYLRVTDFTFKDSLKGWASISAGFSAACLQTTDGGDTWTSINVPFSRIQGSAIYYHKPTNRLFLSVWGDVDVFSVETSWVSTDEGVSWSKWGTPTLNSCIFLNDKVGFVSSVAAGSNDNPTNWLKTTDGGVSWNKSNYKVEAWQPLFSQKVGAMYIAHDAESVISRSTDGENWTDISNPPPQYLTGCIKEGDCGLYIQSIETLPSFFLSKDGGLTWKALFGPPGVSDTRFAVLGSSIIAGDYNGGLWRFDPTILPSADTITLRVSNPCQAIRDTSVSLFNLFCEDVKLTKIDASNGNIGLHSLSKNLSTGDSVRIPIKILADQPGTFTSTITAHFLRNAEQVDVPVYVNIVIGEDTSRQYALSKKSLTIDKAILCQTSTDSIVLSNTGCDTLTLDKVTIDSLKNSIGEFTQDYQLPIRIPPGRRLAIPVSITPTYPGTLTTNISLHIGRSNGTYQDTVVPVLVKSSWNNSSFTEYSVINLDTISLCSGGVASSILKNSGCNSFTITETYIDPSSGLTLDTSVQNKTLGVGDSLLMGFHYHPAHAGPFEDSVEVQIKYPFGTTERFYVKVQGVVIPSLHAFTLPESVQFDSIPLCSTFDTTFTIKNLLSCDSLVVDSISVVPATLASVVFTNTATLGSGDSLQVRIHGTVLSETAGRIIVHSREGDTTIALLFTTRAGAAVLSVASDSLWLGEVAIGCSKLQKTVTISNAGCDNLVIDSIITTPPFSTSFTTPYDLSSGSRGEVTLQCDGQLMQAPGILSAPARIYYHGVLEKTRKVAVMQLSSTGINPPTIGIKLGNSISAEAGEVFPIPISIITKNLPEDLQLKTMKISLDFNPDLVSPITCIAANDQSQQIALASRSNGVDFVLTSDKLSLLNADSTLVAYLNLQLYVSDTTQTSITISNTTFEFDSSTCYTIFPLGESLAVNLTMSCSDSVLYKFMRQGAELKAVQIYPNPSTGRVTIRTTGITELAHYTVYDLLGKQVMDSDLITGVSTINLSKLSSGVFYLRVSDGVFSATRRIEILP